MNIYTEERSYWMGSDVAKYRRKRAVSLPDYAMPRPVKYGLAHPELCFGDYEPEHLVIVHLRQYDVTNWRRRALTILISIVANLILLGLATIEHIIRERRKRNV